MEGAEQCARRQLLRTRRAALIAPLLLVLGVHELVVRPTFSADTPAKRTLQADDAPSSSHTAPPEKKTRPDLTEPKTRVWLVMRLSNVTQARLYLRGTKTVIRPDDEVGPNKGLKVIRMHCRFDPAISYRVSAKTALKKCHTEAQKYYRENGLGDVSLVTYEVKEEELEVMSSRLGEAKGVPPESIPIFLYCLEKGEADTKESECHGGSGPKYQPGLQYHQRNIGLIGTTSHGSSLRSFPLHFDREQGDTEVKIRWKHAKVSCDNRNIAEVIFITANGRDPPLLHGPGDETAPMIGKCRLEELKDSSLVPTASFSVESVIGEDTTDVTSSGAIFTLIDPPQLVPFVTPTPQYPENILVFHLGGGGDQRGSSVPSALQKGGTVENVMCAWNAGAEDFAACYDQAKDRAIRAGSVFITTSTPSYLIELFRDWETLPESLKGNYRVVIQGSIKEPDSWSASVSYLDVAFSPALWYSYVRQPVKSFRVSLFHEFAHIKHVICFDGQLSFFSQNWVAKVDGERGEKVLHKLRGYISVVLGLDSGTLVAENPKLELTFDDRLDLAKNEEKPEEGGSQKERGAPQGEVGEDHIEFLGCRDSPEGRSKDSGSGLPALHSSVSTRPSLKTIAIGVNKRFQVRSTRIFKEGETVPQAV